MQFEAENEAYDEGYYRHKEGMPEDYDDDLQAKWLEGMQDNKADEMSATIDNQRDNFHYGE